MRPSLVKSSKPKPKTFREKLRNWLYPEPITKIIQSSSLSSNSMSFNLYRANGGFVIEISNYNTGKDQYQHNLYIVTDEKDLGHELGKIITLQGLKL